MESLYKQATQNIVSEYKKDNSIEGIKKIFTDIDKGIYPHLTKIVQENKENPFFTPEEAKIMKQLYNEHKSFSFLKHVILMDGLIEATDKEKVLNQFYNYLEQQNPLCFCGEKYLSKDEQYLLMMVKFKKDKFKTVYNKKLEEEKLKTEQLLRVANNLIEFYIQTNDYDKTIQYAKEDLKITTIKMKEILKSLKNTNIDKKDVLYKIGRKIVIPKGTEYINGIIESLDENAIMVNLNIKPYQLQTDIIKYNVDGLLSPEESLKLDNFYKKYVNYCNEIKNKSKNISPEEYEQMVNIIENYMDNETISIEKYCESINIQTSEFYKTIDILRELNPSLIKKYENYTKNKSAKMYAIIVSKVREIIPMIENGVQIENSNTRPFDILDYYSIISININEILRIIQSHLNQNEYLILRRFSKKYENDKPLNYRDVYNTKLIMGCQYDENNNIIPRTGKEVTLEEKKQIINFLKNNSIPVTKNTYSLALNRWIQGILTIEKQSIIQETEELAKKR